MESRGFEARPHLKADLVEISRSVNVEEAGRATQLLQIGLTESLLQNDIDEVLTHVVVLVCEAVREMDLAACVLVNGDHGLFTAKHRLEHKRLLQLRQSVYGLSTDDIKAKGLLERGLLTLDDLVDAMSLPELIWLDIQDILIDTSILAKSQPVLI